MVATSTSQYYSDTLKVCLKQTVEASGLNVTTDEFTALERATAIVHQIASAPTNFLGQSMSAGELLQEVTDYAKIMHSLANGDEDRFDALNKIPGSAIQKYKETITPRKENNSQARDYD